MSRLTLALGAFLLGGCATLESGADHVRDFAVEHPIVVACGVAFVTIEVIAFKSTIPRTSTHGNNPATYCAINPNSLGCAP